MPEARTVGFVGAGSMGSAMVRRLLAAGHPVVVHNRTRRWAAGLEALGARWADTPADVAAASDVVLGCLRDTGAVRDVHLGPVGLAEAARPGQVVVEHATFEPALATELADRYASRGAVFVDAPVTGGPERAAAGTLVAMVGADSLGPAADVVAVYVERVEHLGGVGRGLQLKLVNQLLVSIHMAAAAEAAALLGALDLPREQATRVLTSGWAHSTMLERTLDQLSHDRRWDTGATIGGMVEVQELVATIAPAEPVFAAARAVFDRAVTAGLGEADPASLLDARAATLPAEVRR